MLAWEKIKFGGYDWLVLEEKDDKALLLSEKIIEKRPYSAKREGVTWFECDLRKYLNNVFYNSFDEQDKMRICKTRIKNNDNFWFETKGGVDTFDRIFLLSIGEVVRYLGDNGRLDEYAYKKDTHYDIYYLDDNYNAERVAEDLAGKAAWWWLRSPGLYINKAAIVADRLGWIEISGSAVHHRNGGVRPALWLEL